MPTSHTEIEARVLDAALPSSGAVVVEAGCGRTTRLAAWRDRIATLIGVDVDAEAGAQNTALDRFIAADLCASLPLDDGACDLVYSQLRHRAPGASVRRLRRVAPARCAQAGVSSFSPATSRARSWPPRGACRGALVVAAKRAGAGAAEHDVIPTAYRANTPERVDELLTCAGLARVELHRVGTLHRYAARVPLLPGIVTAVEGRLPARRRATLVGWYRTR